MAAVLRAVLARIREFFLLEEAERRISKVSESQRELSRLYHAAASKRLSVARLIQTPRLTPVSLSLYRDAAFMFAMAFLASSRDDVDFAKLDHQALLEATDRALKARGLSVPPNLELTKPTLVASDPMTLDRLESRSAIRVRQELEATTRWLSSLIEFRSPRQFVLARLSRIVLALAAGAFLVRWLATHAPLPGNIALNKFARSTTPAYDTAPQGAVDGKKDGRFGFHSAEESFPWLTIDLGRRHHIASIKVFGRGDCCFDQSVPLALEASDDGDSFHIVDERWTPFRESDPWVLSPEGLVTRFLRLKVKRTSVLVLSEVEVYRYLW
jgi:hypothetical protein